jgi:hypothetical protein
MGVKYFTIFTVITLKFSFTIGLNMCFVPNVTHAYSVGACADEICCEGRIIKAKITVKKRTTQS